MPYHAVLCTPPQIADLQAKVEKTETERLRMEAEARDSSDQLREMAEKVFQLLERLKLVGAAHAGRGSGMVARCTLVLLVTVSPCRCLSMYLYLCRRVTVSPCRRVTVLACHTRSCVPTG